MTLKDVYQHFLDLPNPISLSENATLHYITTLTTFQAPGPIVRHLESQNSRVVKTRNARIISSIEASNALALEVETVLEFISGGGSYLPGLENFIVDKIATIPTTHIVYFDGEQKISQIRISWDQASLLKQAGVIGSRGSNWPVVDGKDQIRLIETGYNSAPAGGSRAPHSPRGRSENHNNTTSRSVSPSKKHIKDPYASLDLFSPKPTEENHAPAKPNPVAPRTSARPPPREMSELFAAGHEDHEPGSPKKPPMETVVPSKGNGTQKYVAPRLFAEDRDEPAAVGYKSNPAKYNHFDIGDAIEDDPMQHRENNLSPRTAIPMRPKTNKNQSQWNFEDFATPGKAGQKVRGQDVVHFSLEDDGNSFETPSKNMTGRQRWHNDTHFEFQDDGTPIERHVVPKARKDAESHFHLDDNPSPAPTRISARPNSSAGGRQGLYANNLYDENGEGESQAKVPLSTINNNTYRKNDFDSHFTIADVSPANDKANSENHPIADSRKQAAHNMDSHWDPSDQSLDQVKAAPNHSRLRKGTESHWSIGEEASPFSTTNGRSQTQKSFWDF